jgi:hypothetical protein
MLSSALGPSRLLELDINLSLKTSENAHAQGKDDPRVLKLSFKAIHK